MTYLKSYGLFPSTPLTKSSQVTSTLICLAVICLCLFISIDGKYYCQFERDSCDTCFQSPNIIKAQRKFHALLDYLESSSCHDLEFKATVFEVRVSSNTRPQSNGDGDGDGDGGTTCGFSSISANVFAGARLEAYGRELVFACEEGSGLLTMELIEADSSHKKDMYHVSGRWAAIHSGDNFSQDLTGLSYLRMSSASHHSYPSPMNSKWMTDEFDLGSRPNMAAWMTWYHNSYEVRYIYVIPYEICDGVPVPQGPPRVAARPYARSATVGAMAGSAPIHISSGQVFEGLIQVTGFIEDQSAISYYSGGWSSDNLVREAVQEAIFDTQHVFMSLRANLWIDRLSIIAFTAPERFWDNATFDSYPGTPRLAEFWGTMQFADADGSCASPAVRESKFPPSCCQGLAKVRGMVDLQTIQQEDTNAILNWRVISVDVPESCSSGLTECWSSASPTQFLSQVLGNIGDFPSPLWTGKPLPYSKDKPTLAHPDDNGDVAIITRVSEAHISACRTSFSGMVEVALQASMGLSSVADPLHGFLIPHTPRDVCWVGAKW
uniref:Uncharacterized protein n=1 Tax=Tetraselmis sp. GSL018 TaxID=582737 RepID=A0A061SD32_9CHLO|mmetsp:Transcript_20390/g.48547  ORF Transcript_20390/g.48547 Transcript_20390/m.48547 type:complete len:549 (+) Transcript_20390:210-1856(+)